MSTAVLALLLARERAGGLFPDPPPAAAATHPRGPHRHLITGTRVSGSSPPHLVIRPSGLSTWPPEPSDRQESVSLSFTIFRYPFPSPPPAPPPGPLRVAENPFR
jgi:hypothetical protein